MTRKQWIKELRAKPSTKYPDRYDVDGAVFLYKKNLTTLPIPFDVVNGYFDFSRNELTSLQGVPKWVGGYFDCADNKLTTLDHLPKYIGRNLYCQDNPLQNLNGLKDVFIKRYIYISYTREYELDYWVRALYNTNLDVLEYHYDNHKYEFVHNHELERYVMNELEEIIKIKKLKRDLRLV